MIKTNCLNKLTLVFLIIFSTLFTANVVEAVSEKEMMAELSEVAKLIDAVEKDDIAAVAQFLQEGVDPNRIYFFIKPPSVAVSNLLLDNPSKTLEPNRFLYLIMELFFTDEDLYLYLEQFDNLVKLALQKGGNIKTTLEKYGIATLNLNSENIKILFNNGLTPDEFANHFLSTYSYSRSRNSWIEFALQQGAEPKNFTYPWYKFPHNQGLIIHRLVNILSNNSHDSSEDENVASITKEFVKKMGEQPGYCNGLTILWLYSKWLQYSNLKISGYDNRWFYDVTEVITSGNSEAINRAAADIEKYAQMIYFLQQPEFGTKKLPYTDLVQRLNYCMLATNDGSLKLKYHIAASFTPPQFYELLKKIINDGELVTFHFIFNYIDDVGAHATGLFKQNNIYYYYDPNNDNGEYKSSSLKDIVEIISNSLPGKDSISSGRSWCVVDIRVYGVESSAVNTRPTQEEIIKEYISQLDKYTLEKNILLFGSFDEDKKLHHQMYPLILNKTKNNNLLLLCRYKSECNKYVEEALKSGTDPNLPLSLQELLCDVFPDKAKRRLKDFIYDHDGTSLLQLACVHDLKEMVEKLLNDPRVDINRINKLNGRNAFMYAAKGDSVGVVRLLIDRKGIVDIDARDTSGKTALMLAAEKASQAPEECDPDDGRTCLQDYIDTIKLLLANGANPAKHDYYGNTALKLASNEDGSVDPRLEELLKPKN